MLWDFSPMAGGPKASLRLRVASFARASAPRERMKRKNRRGRDDWGAGAVSDNRRPTISPDSCLLVSIRGCFHYSYPGKTGQSFEKFLNRPRGFPSFDSRRTTARQANHTEVDAQPRITRI